MSSATLAPEITEEERRQRARDHVQRVVDRIIAAEPEVLFGFRDGPCVVEYRDWWHRGWPQRRGFSCLGCKHHERDPEYGCNYCVHPLFLAKYDSKQSVANNNWWRRELADVNAFSCPVLRMAGVQDHCPQPEPDEIPGKERSKAHRDEGEIFRIPQRLPYYITEAYARGEPVDQQIVRF
jgi:hypothetical protein